MAATMQLPKMPLQHVNKEALRNYYIAKTVEPSTLPDFPKEEEYAERVISSESHEEIDNLEPRGRASQ